MSHSIGADLRLLGGVAHVQELLARGYTRRRLAALAHTGQVLRPRIGWYASPALSVDEVRAVRVGGRVGCVTAARLHGLPAPADDRLHVSLEASATRLRKSTDSGTHVYAGEEPGVVWHRSNATGASGKDRVRVPLLTSIQELMDCVSFEWAVAAVDRVRNARLTDEQSLRTALERSPTGRLIHGASDGGAESPLESIVRVRLALEGVTTRSQAPIGPYRADLLVDGWLVVECDGRTHAVAEQFELDRRRDGYFAAAGYRVLRFSYRQVLHEWESTVHTIRAVLRHGAPETRLA